MTWWIIALIVVGYMFITFVTVGILQNMESEDGVLFAGIFWPITLAGFIIICAIALSMKLGEFIYEKIYDVMHKHKD